jgi:DNA-binding SARP family transcriptional activator/tetratricopeptide (TPR) repeat protein
VVEFRILGPLEVRAGGRVLELGAVRQRRVLAGLLLRANRVVDVSRLVAVAWDDDPPATARRQVQNRVANLRAVLTRAGGFIDTADSGYLLRVGPGELDAAVFDDLVERGRAAADPAPLRQALALWRGPALSGLGGAVLAGEAAALEERRLAACEDCFDMELAGGRHADLVPEIRALVAAHPVRERLVAQLMTALHRGGRDAEAQEVYRELAGRLADELGIDPSPELRRLREVCARRGGHTSVVPQQLPADVAGFTGRQLDLARLDSLLSDGQTQRTLVISAIAGTAGVGKTALAVRWAHQVRDKFPDGQLYVNLRGYAQTPPLRPIDALAGFLRALGVESGRVPTEPDDAVSLYRELLRDRRVLVVLDNAASPEQVRPLLPAGPDCLALVTSRDALTELTVRDGARRVTVEVLAPAEAVALVAGVIGADRVAAEADGAADLARLCAYLPLALRIATANLVEGESIGGYTTRLAAGNRLAGLAVDGDEQAAVRAAFALSYSAQPSPARRLFRLLGLVPGPDVTADAAAALADIPVDAARGLLDGLAAAHLIEEHAPGRYACHDLLRLYAGERARAEPEPDAPRRLYEYYRRAADAAEAVRVPGGLRVPALRPLAAIPVAPVFATEADALAWLDAERANLVAAVIHAAAHGPSRAAWSIANAFSGYLLARMYLVDLLDVDRAALAAAEAEGEWAAQAAVHLSLARMYLSQSRYDDAIERLHRTRDLARQGQWPQAESAALCSLGNAYRMVGRLDSAREHLVLALALDRELGRAPGVANDLLLLGIVAREQGDLAQAERWQTSALDLYRRLGSRGWVATVLDNLGELYHDMGRLDEARAHLVEALTLMCETATVNGEADVLRLLAAVELNAGQPARAAELAGQALVLAREIRAQRCQAHALNVLAAVDDHLGRHQAAVDRRRQALRLTADTGNRYPEIEATVGLAAALCHLGRYREARAEACRALAAATGSGYRLLEVRARSVLARIEEAG